MTGSPFWSSKLNIDTFPFLLLYSSLVVKLILHFCLLDSILLVLMSLLITCLISSFRLY